MENVYIVKKSGGSLSATVDQNRLSLLLRSDGLEIMREHIGPDSMVWVSPGEGRDAIEFFCVLSGMLSICLDDGLETMLPGDSFYVDSLKKDLRLFSPCDTELLYITNRPVFDQLIGQQTDLDALLLQISRKDESITRHSRNVQRVLDRLYRELDVPAPAASLDDLEKAALFHDVGKCMVPDEVLRKKGPYSDDDRAMMQRHPVYGAAIVSSRIGATAGSLVRSHHERLDGSGYPDGLHGEQISFGARLLAVSEVFDAMMHAPQNGSAAASPLGAARAIAERPDLYDGRIAAALLRLVENLDPEICGISAT